MGAKIRDPEGDLVATYRVISVRIEEPTTRDSAPHQIIWQAESSIGRGSRSGAATRRTADRQRLVGLGPTG